MDLYLGCRSIKPNNHERAIQKNSLAHLKKAQGMIKKVITMIEEDAYCMDVLQQSLAATGFIKSANKVILENHLNSCFKAGMQSKSDAKQQALIDEVLGIMYKT
ncbi:metal-sensitive transcriptional regulator [Candidatus Peregrinibacteria bacterium]|nr:metal-sensitive transcriptional regulator [Candidatus Peregrinibacteria bacterium]